MRGSAVIHVENNHEGIVAHSAGVIALLPVAQKAATEPESTYPSSASLVSQTKFPRFEGISEDSLTDLHNKLRHHNCASADKSAARSLRNLACRRARHSDAIGQRNVNSVFEEQYRTTGATDPIRSFARNVHLLSGEPTVRIERLEEEVHRYGRIVPTCNGSYHVLDTLDPESSLDGSSLAIRVDGEMAHVCGAMDRTGGAVNRVDSESGVMDRVGVANGSDDSVDDGCNGAIDLDDANVSSQIENGESRSSYKRHRQKKSLHHFRSSEIGYTTKPGNCSENLGGISVQEGVRESWQPVYEDISDPDSDQDFTKRMCGLASTEDAIIDCDRSRESAGSSRHRHSAAVAKNKANAVNRRRHSAPDDTNRKRKKKERREKERRRRWSFNTDSEVSQADHAADRNKLYLNRLVFSKEQKMKTPKRESWTITIDIARDQHSVEEFQFPELPATENMALKQETEDKEDKEETATTEEDSSVRANASQRSSSINEHTKSGDCTSSEFNKEMNIEDEDTIEAPKGSFSVSIGDVNILSSSANAEEEHSPLSNETAFFPEDMSPRTVNNSSVMNSSSYIRNGTECNCEGPTGTPETQTNKAGVVTVTSVDDSVSTEVISDDESDLNASPTTEGSASDTPFAERVENRVKDVSSRATNTHERSNIESHHRHKALSSKTEKGLKDHDKTHESELRRKDKSSSRRSSQESSDVASRKVEHSCRTPDSILAKSGSNREVCDAGSKLIPCEGSMPINRASSSHISQEPSYSVFPDSDSEKDCNNVDTEEERFPQKMSNHSQTTLDKISSQKDVIGQEQNIGSSFAASPSNNSSDFSRTHYVSTHYGQVKENENCGVELDKDVAAEETNSAHQTLNEHSIEVQNDNEYTTGNIERGCESRELTAGTAKKSGRKTGIGSTDKQHNESSGDKIHKNPRGPRKLRYSRRSFRHESIQMFKVSTAFPPHTTTVPWRYKCKKTELPDTVDTQGVDIPLPIPPSTQPRFEDNVTSIEFEDDIPSPASLTIDLGESNKIVSESSNVEEDKSNRKRSNSNSSDGEHDVASPLKRRNKSNAEDSAEGRSIQDASPNNEQRQHQSGDPDSESSDEGQSKQKRKKVKKRKSDDSSVIEEVMQHIFTAQMQEKGRRLAQELPRFNWLEEKIRNGGVSKVLPTKRPSMCETPRGASDSPQYTAVTYSDASKSNGGTVLETPHFDTRADPTSEATRSLLGPHFSEIASEASSTNVPPPSSSPTEYRNGKRLQEYLSRPHKKARHLSPAITSELGNHGHEALPPLRPTHLAEMQKAPLALTQVTPLQRQQCPPMHSPSHIQQQTSVPDREYSPHRQQQSSRIPVIVSASELAKSSDVSPLLEQLTSGGELEVTLATPPTSSSASSDSGVGSASSRRRSSDAETPEIMHVSVKPVHAPMTSPRNDQNDLRPRDAAQMNQGPPTLCTTHRRMSYGVEQLSQPHQPDPSRFHEHAPVYGWSREPPRWQGDGPSRIVQEITASNPETLPPPPPHGNPDRSYSDRIATMARHAATSFDTGFGMGLSASQETSHRAPRHPQNRPSDSTHQPPNYQRDQMLKTCGHVPPLVQESGTYDSRFPQHSLYNPSSYMISQQPIRPQVVRPSAQYPASLGHYHPPPTYMQAMTAVSSSQGLITGIPQYSKSLVHSQQSTLPPHVPQRERDPTNSAVQSPPVPLPTAPSPPVSSPAVSSPPVPSPAVASPSPLVTSSAVQLPVVPSTTVSSPEVSSPIVPSPIAQSPTVPSVSSSSEQEIASTESQTSSPTQHEAPDPQTEEKNSSLNIEEIRKVAKAAAEELEKLEQLEITTMKDLRRLNIAHAKTKETLEKTRKQLADAEGARKVIQPRLAVPSATGSLTSESEETLPTCVSESDELAVACENNQVAQRSSNTADSSGSSIPSFQQSPSVTLDSSESSSGLHATLPTVLQENHQPAVKLKNQPAQRPSATADDTGSCLGFHTTLPTVSQENCQPAVQCENHESVQRSRITADSAGSSILGLQTTLSTASREKHESTVRCENRQLAQTPSVTADGAINSVSELHVTLQRVARANYESEQRPNVTADDAESSVPDLHIRFPKVACENLQSAVVFENCQSRVVCENNQSTQIPSDTADDTRSSIPGFHMAVTTVGHEQYQSAFSHEKRQSVQRPSDTESDARSSIPGLQTALPMVAHENHQLALRPSSTTDNIRSSIPGLHARENHQSAVTCGNHQSVVTRGNLQSAVTHENHESAVTRENRLSTQRPSVTTGAITSSVAGLSATLPTVAPEHPQSAQRRSASIDATRSSMPGLNITYPTVTCENHQSGKLPNATVTTTRNSIPTMVSMHAPFGQQNQEPIQRPYPPPPPLLARPSLPVPIPQRPPPTLKLTIPHHLSLFQSQPASRPQMVPPPDPVSIVQRPQHSQPISVNHSPLPPLQPKPCLVSQPPVCPQPLRMPRPPLYPQQMSMPQTVLPSQSLPVCQMSPHSQSLSMSRTSLHSESLPVSRTSQSLSMSQASPHSQSFQMPQTSPHSRYLPMSQVSPHSQSLPGSQTHFQSLPLSRASPHSQSLPMSQTSPHSQALPMPQTSPCSDLVSISQHQLHRHPLKFPQHSLTGIQSLQLPADELRNTATIPQLSSIEMVAAKNKAMPPPPIRQHHATSRDETTLPNPPRLTGPHLSISLHSRHTSPQVAPASITAHPGHSPSHVNVFPRGSSMQQHSTIMQEAPILPQVGNTTLATSNKLPNSTLEECPIDLSISKQKLPSENGNIPSVPVSSTIPSQHHGQNAPAQSSTSSRFNQDIPQNQPSVVQHPNPEEKNVADHSVILHHAHRMLQLDISRQIPAENSRLQQQILTGSGRIIPSQTASMPMANIAVGNDGLGRRPNMHPTPGSSDGYKHFGTPHHQNIEDGSVLHRQRVHFPTHHGTVHYTRHPAQNVHQYHMHRPIPGSSYIPVYPKTVLQDPRAEQQRREHTVEPHVASAVASDRDRYCSANKQISPTAAMTPDKSTQGSHPADAAGERSQPHSHLICGRCNQTARFMCSACHNAWYCSSDCQLRHWNHHSQDCRRHQ